MNNEPVAWIDPKELDMDVSTSVTKNRQFKSDIPLYVKPQKYCPSENNEAYEKGFIDGMAKQRDSRVQQMVEGYTHPVKEQDESFDRTASHMAGEYVSYKAELTNEEINVVAILQDAEIVPVGHEIWKTGEEFNKYKRIVLATAKALRKASEK